MKARLFFHFLLIFFLCGCVRHGGDRFVRPSAVPEKRITKTAIPAGGIPERDLSGDDPWERCRVLINSESDLSAIAGLEPEEFRRRVQITFMVRDADAETSFILSRCMAGKLYACPVSESTNCLEPLNFSTEPNDRMKEICTDPALDGGILTTRMSGINSAFQWVCRNGEPVITAQIAEADAAGYDKSLWFEIPAPELPEIIR